MGAIEYSDEQKSIIDAMLDPEIKLVKVIARAGTGKSFISKEATLAMKPTCGLNITYNKAIADEASETFPKEMDCRTLHSYAYKYTAGRYGFEIANMSYRDIEERLHFFDKIVITMIISGYFVSKYTKIADYIETLDKQMYINTKTRPEKLHEIAKGYISKMFSGKMPIPHDGYLKLFHVYLANGEVTLPDYDLVIADEAQDFTAVSFEIFKLIKARKKMVLGDPNQMIYRFNNTINAFEELKDVGVTLNITRSFRCSEAIARRVENVMRNSIEPEFKFVGIDKDEGNGLFAYIGRTNAALIERMAEYVSREQPFRTVRHYGSIFGLMLSILKADKPDFSIKDKEYKFLEKEIKEFKANYKRMNNRDASMTEILNFCDDEYAESDPEITATVKTISQIGIKKIWSAYFEAKKNFSNKNIKRIVVTAHSSKGLTFERVQIATDITSKLDEIRSYILDNGGKMPTIDSDNEKYEDYLKIKDEGNLIYVAMTRAEKILQFDALGMDKQQ
jgi:superfamily I DNA/RNA helicase